MRFLIVEDDSNAGSILALALRKQAGIVDETTLGEDTCQLAGIYDF